MTRPAAEREWRQFRLLARDSLRKLLNSAMLARDADPIQFALWTTSLVATPPTLYGFGQLFKYSALRGAPSQVVEAIVLADRMFFVVYSLIAAALLAAMTWDALYPDRDEQEILGALPVRPRTATAARLAAAVGMAATFAVAINAPSGVFFSLVATSHPVGGFLPVALVAHLASTVAGCVTVFLALLLIRGAVSLVLGTAVTDRLATGLQLITIVALVEVFFYLPSILPRLVQRMTAGDTVALWLPSTWFGAMYNALAGPRRPVYLGEAWLGLAVLAAAVAIVVPLYLVPARMMARRALESQPGAGQRAWLAATVHDLATWLARTGPGGSVARFSLLSLARSRRHALVVVTYAGVGVAFALLQVIASGLRGGIHIDTPGRALLAVPLFLMLFLVTGTRAAFKVPRDVEANWVFRLHRPSALAASAGTWSALFLIGVVPVVLLAVLGAVTAGWPTRAVALMGTFDVLAGALLLESALYGWALIPFACARPDGQEAVQTRWLAAMGPFILFTFGGSILQAAALRSGRVALGLGVGLAGMTLIVGRLRRYRVRRETVPFDGPPGHIEVLNLSEALH